MLFDEDPVEVFNRNVWVHVFHEPDPKGLIDLGIPVDHLMFGSDFPHPEGMADPLAYAEVVKRPAPRAAGADHGRLAREGHEGRRVRLTIRAIAAERGVYYDPYDVEINADPYPTFRRLRDEAPIYYNEQYDVWALSPRRRRGGADRLEDLLVRRAATSSRSSRRTSRGPGVILWEDPPVHTDAPRLLSRVFTPSRMNALEEQVRVLRVVPRSARRHPIGSTS